MKSYFMADFIFLVVNNRVENLHSCYPNLLADFSVYVYWLTKGNWLVKFTTGIPSHYTHISNMHTAYSSQLFPDN